MQRMLHELYALWSKPLEWVLRELIIQCTKSARISVKDSNTSDCKLVLAFDTTEIASYL